MTPISPLSAYSSIDSILYHEYKQIKTSRSPQLLRFRRPPGEGSIPLAWDLSFRHGYLRGPIRRIAGYTRLPREIPAPGPQGKRNPPDWAEAGIEIDDLARVVPAPWHGRGRKRPLPLQFFKLWRSKYFAARIASTRMLLVAGCWGSDDRQTRPSIKRPPAEIRSSSLGAGGLIPRSFWIRDAIAGEGKLCPAPLGDSALADTQGLASPTCVRFFCSRALRRRMPNVSDTGGSNRRGSYITYWRAGTTLRPGRREFFDRCTFCVLAKNTGEVVGF